MGNRAFRFIAAALSILFATGIPTKAGPVVVSDVVQLMSNSQNLGDLKLRSISQNSMALSAEVKSNMIQSEAGSANKTGIGTTSTTDSLLDVVSLTSDDQQVGVDIINADDVEGTICDCGEIPVAGGGFPKWPLLFLGVIPFFFIDGDDTPTPTPTPPPAPTPTPTPTPPVPEPASLLLFGTGLIAFAVGLRRRYARTRLTFTDSGDGGGLSQ